MLFVVNSQPVPKLNVTPTKRGKFILSTIMAAAGQRLSDSIDDVGRFRRIHEATDYLRKANKSLRGPLQLSFFEKELKREYPKELKAFNPRSFNRGIR